MDEVLSSVKALSVSDLRDKLTSYGQSVGPITPTTKSLFQKKLAKYVYTDRYGDKPPEMTEPKQAGDHTDTKTPEESKSTENVQRAQDSKAGDADSNRSVFYAVSLDSSDKNTEGENVYTDKMAAFSVMKKHPGSRFKVFRNKAEAVEYARNPSYSSPIVSKPSNGNLEHTSTGVTSEKSNFKGPKTQDLTELRRTIERGDKNQFLSMVWSNPRYLVSSGDTPVILHEGLRYNALHVAAHKNKPDMAKLVLETLLDPEFTKQLYAGTNDNADTQTRRIDFLVDLYLNTPEKGSGESPLHFASKYGFPDVIEVILGYPGLDRQLRNKYGETPEEVVCSRCQNSTPELKNRIMELLKGLCYVPLLRSEDNTTVPVIGQPWSPDHSSDLTRSQVKKSPKDPTLAVRARAGPMSPSQAKLFYRQWVAPPTNSPFGDKRMVTKIRRQDGEKGMERIGRQLAHEMHIPWLEYWEFLDEFVDFSTEEGLQKLEDHFKKRQTSVVFSECLENFGPLNMSDSSSVFCNTSQRDLQSSFLDPKSRLLIQPSSLSCMSNNPENTDPEELDENLPRTEEGSEGSGSICDNNNKPKGYTTDSEKDTGETQGKRDVWSYREPSEGTGQEQESPEKKTDVVSPEKAGTSKNVLNLSQVSKSVRFGKKEEEKKSDPWAYRQGLEITNTDRSSPSKNEQFPSPSRLDSEGSTSFDESVVATFSGMKLSSGDEEFHTPESQPRSDSESFRTPNQLEVSFNTAVTNLCDDLKRKLVFTPEQQSALSVGRMVGCPYGKISVPLGNSHHANDAFRILSNSKMLDLDEDEESADQPAPVLVGLDARSAGSDPSCVVANVWVLNDSLHTSSVNNVFPDTKVLLEDSKMRNQLLNIEGPKLMTIDISCDEKYTTRQRTVPVQALFFQAKMTLVDVYIHGLKHAKTDLDVLRAVDRSSLNTSKFPLIQRWLQRVSSLADDNKQSWPSPARLRREALEQGIASSRGGGHLSPLVSSSPFSPQRPRPFMSSPLIGNWAPRAALFQSSPMVQPLSMPVEKFKPDLDLSAKEEKDSSH
ncbi:ankyrin repeat and LEM domain-containing protein 2-like [Haliotis cracherodii]|uniref:ankyrin repeat and LEM domain-containing protein 2-like n=1 Tax=Haliotis cracherodii TaxID=6455 RepID=UPI0039EBB682